MQDYTIISYATKNQKYLDYAKRLNQFFADYNVNNHHICFYEPVSFKMEGCLIKPSFILNELLKRQKPVLCIDVDSIINKYPYEIDKFISQNNDFDIGFVFTPERKNIISNGIHLWNYTNNAIIFLYYWKTLCDNPKLKTLDHHRLINTYYEYQKRINIIDIREYVKDWFVAQFSRNDSQLYY